MKAIVFSDRNAVSLADIEEPVAGPGEVVVQVRASGLCHTDIEVLKGNYGASAFPLVPGHEYAGIILGVGSDVDQFKPGDRVVVDPNVECGHCRACQRGWAHLCENLGAYGVTRNGGFAEYSVVAASAVHPIGDMPFDIAALSEPLGCVLNGLDAAHVERAGNALIFGAGPIGLLLAIAADASGVDDITLVDIDEHRLAFASGLGFNVAASGSSDLARLHQRTDLVIDATGVATVAQSLPDYMANGGVGLFFGVCPADTRIQISPHELFRRQLTLAGSHSLNHNIPHALEILRQSGGKFRKVVSHRLSIEAMREVVASGPPLGGMKLQLTLPS